MPDSPSTPNSILREAGDAESKWTMLRLLQGAAPARLLVSVMMVIRMKLKSGLVRLGYPSVKTLLRFFLLEKVLYFLSLVNVFY